MVNKVLKTIEHGGKKLTLVKESCDFPEFESLILCHKKPNHIRGWVFYIVAVGIRTERNATPRWGVACRRPAAATP